MKAEVNSGQKISYDDHPVSKKVKTAELNELVNIPDGDVGVLEKVNQKSLEKGMQCPYLDTINRNVLDFDFEKLCSVTLTRLNVYACLVCGKYFEGRGQKTHAQTHSVSEGHRVFMNLESAKFYCLPDNYEIFDSSLNDIVYVLNPEYDKQSLAKLNDISNAKQVRAYSGQLYWPGVVGLNNIKANDYCNVIFQALSHVPPIRNHFLTSKSRMFIHSTSNNNSTSLVHQRFGELIRKLWNPKNFKTHVSPHEMLQAVVLSSKKRFEITKRSDCIDFLSWFLNALHQADSKEATTSSAVKNASSPSSVIYDTFRGKMRIYSKKLVATAASSGPTTTEEGGDESEGAQGEEQWEVKNSSFLFLTTELPPVPLFKDAVQENIIPQVSIYNILSKFNGQTEREYKTYKENFLKKFELTKLPPYLILCIKRFTKNSFYVEKNCTIVNFPIKSIDFSELMLSEELRVKYRARGGGSYDLMANVVHEGSPENGAYKVHVLHQGSGKWFEMQDLRITSVLPEILPLSEAYIQIYARKYKKNES